VHGTAAGCARGAGAAASERDWLARRGPYRSRLNVRSIGSAGCVRELAVTVAEEEMVRFLGAAGQDVEYSRRKARALVSLDAVYSRCRVLSTESENTRFPGGPGCRVLSTESEKTRFPGCGVFRMSSTLDGKREHSFPRCIWMSSTLNRLLWLLRTDH